MPVTLLPDREDVRFKREGEWHLEPASPYFRATRAFLIDGRAISYAESCLGIVEHYKLGEIIGQPTAGTNGNVNPIAYEPRLTWKRSPNFEELFTCARMTG